MTNISDQLIVALDYSSIEEARNLVTLLGTSVSFYKVGMELAYDRGGIAFAKELKDSGKRVFLDLKLHDIPNTVERAVKKITEHGVDFLSVHGYPDTVRAAKNGAGGSDLKIFGISVLTSYTDASLHEAGYTVSMPGLLKQRADCATTVGIAGIVCAVEDAKRIRAWSNGALEIITPGIRMPDQDSNDQRRLATPKEAIAAGTNYMVIGRPITQSVDPRKAVELILENAAS